MAGLYQERIRSQGIGAVYLPNFGSRAQDDNQKTLSCELGSNPLKNIKAISPRHVEVEEDDAREWEKSAVRINSFAGQIGDGLRAVWDFENWIDYAGCVKGAANQETIVGIIIDQQNNLSMGHRW